MAIPKLSAIVEPLDGLVAVGAVVLGGDDGAIGDCHDRGARGSSEVQAGVVVCPQATAHPEACSQAISRRGDMPEVLDDLLAAARRLVAQLGQGGDS